MVLDVGAQGDAEGANRIAGTHWGQIVSLAGKTVRRLAPAALEGKPNEMGAPHSYFYLALPSEWKDNLRDQWFEMVMVLRRRARQHYSSAARRLARADFSGHARCAVICI